MKRYIVGILPLLAFLIGCQSLVSSNSVEFSELISNPETYLNNEIVVKGKFAEAIRFFPLPDGTWDSKYLIDDQGYELMIRCEEPNRKFDIGSIYQAKGSMAYEEVCTCQVKGTLVDQDQWVDYTDKTRTECEKEENRRCKEGTISKLYYFKCAEPMVKK